MLTSASEILVDLGTPQGSVFSGRASMVEFRSGASVVQLFPKPPAALGTIQDGEIVLRVGAEFRRFRLTQAAAGFENGRLTVMAVAIQPTVGQNGHWPRESSVR
jgi:hypothetical protein